MAVGTGIDVHDGVGRSALDDRILTRSEYHNIGIVMGCLVTGSTAAMSYSVAPGSDPVSVAVGSRGPLEGASKFQVPTASIATTPGPASGSRVDVVWARQNDPAKGDANNLAVLGVTQGTPSTSPAVPAIPAGAVTLASFSVPQGATRGSQATLIEPGDYAIPYGAALGVLHESVDTQNGQITNNRVTLGSGSFVLPTPRRVALVLRPTVSTLSGTESGALMYRVLVDGQEVVSTIYEFTRYYVTGIFSHMLELPGGRHTVAYTREWVAGPAFGQRYGLISGRQYPGTRFTVEDRGIAS